MKIGHKPQPKRLVGWRFGLLIGSIVGSIALASYPIIISPMINADNYKRMQAIGRKGIKQEDIQPGNMKVWSDPFDRKNE